MKSKLGTYLLIVSALVAPIPCALAAVVDSPTSPNERYGNFGAFFITQRQAPSVRYQELRRADEFASFGSPILITEFSLQREVSSLPIDFTLPNVAIRFSTTPRVPFQISSTFSENIGPNETTVFSGPLRLIDTGGDYGIRIPLQTPFLYDPSQGNLLMDFWNFQTVPTPANGVYVAAFARAPVLQAYFAGAGDAAAVNASTATIGSLFTRFTVTPVPEPSTWALMVSAIAGLLYARWRQTR